MACHCFTMSITHCKSSTTLMVFVLHFVSSITAYLAFSPYCFGRYNTVSWQLHQELFVLCRWNKRFMINGQIWQVEDAPWVTVEWHSFCVQGHFPNDQWDLIAKIKEATRQLALAVINEEMRWICLQPVLAPVIPQDWQRSQWLRETTDLSQVNQLTTAAAPEKVKNLIVVKYFLELLSSLWLSLHQWAQAKIYFTLWSHFEPTNCTGLTICTCLFLTQ